MARPPWMKTHRDESACARRFNLDEAASLRNDQTHRLTAERCAGVPHVEWGSIVEDDFNDAIWDDALSGAERSGNVDFKRPDQLDVWSQTRMNWYFRVSNSGRILSFAKTVAAALVRRKRELLGS